MIRAVLTRNASVAAAAGSALDLPFIQQPQYVVAAQVRQHSCSDP
jgi:hypothetical protein